MKQYSGIVFYGAQGNDNTSSFEELKASRIVPLPMNDGTTEVTEEITVTAPKTPGTFYYTASVDSVDGEEETKNNYINPVTITVEQPDLMVESITLSRQGDNEKTEYISVNPGAKFKLYVSFKNKGPATSDETRGPVLPLHQQDLLGK